MKGSLRLSTTNLTASRHVVVHVHHESTHNFHTRFHTTSTHWSSCPHFLMVASTPILYPETWASLSAPSESTILARDTPVALDSPSMRDSPFVEYPAAPHTHTAHARVSLLWLIPSIGASLVWHHISMADDLAVEQLWLFWGTTERTKNRYYSWPHILDFRFLLLYCKRSRIYGSTMIQISPLTCNNIMATVKITVKPRWLFISDKKQWDARNLTTASRYHLSKST